MEEKKQIFQMFLKAMSLVCKEGMFDEKVFTEMFDAIWDASEKSTLTNQPPTA
jgi:hypothetical protein